MHLICRRVLSTLINGMIISVILTTISLFMALLLWFTGFKPSLDLKWFALCFAILYSFLGSVGPLWLPKLGNKIARIQSHEMKQQNRKFVKVIIKLALFSSVPIMLVWGTDRLIVSITAGDPKMMLLLFAPIVFCGFFTGILIPISIVVGKGKQGIHDILSGLAVVKINEDIGSLLPAKKIIIRSLIVTSIISSVSLMIILKLISVTKLQNYIVNTASAMERLDPDPPVIKEFDSVFLITPGKLRSYEFSQGLRWWVDLTGDRIEQLKASKTIGLPKTNWLDLQGYGLSVKRQQYPLKLLHVDRENTRIIPEGEEILSVFLFVDIGAFYYPEIRGLIDKYFSPRVNDLAKQMGIKTIRIRTVKLAKAGFIVAGYFDEFYVTEDREFWRDQRNANLPVILTWGNIIHSGAGFIRSNDLD